jgi:cation diffusion facilitator family transporter
MEQCCEAKAQELVVLRDQQRRVLIAVLVVNLGMFFVEYGAGIQAGSSALMADSLDMLGDSLVYGFSLYVLQRSLTWRAWAALIKGLLMAAFGLVVLAQSVSALRFGIPPLVPTMLGVGMLALMANGFCFILLWRHRSDDINLRSTWLCSRNDLIANGAVLAAAALVAWSESIWPDVIVGIGIAGLFLRTAFSVLRDSLSEMSRSRNPAISGVD